MDNYSNATPDRANERDTGALSKHPDAIWKVPIPLTSCIGREQEVTSICTLLKRPEVRLLTLLGTGGIGKTRLSLHIAEAQRDEFADGVCFVPLASINEADMIPPMIAHIFDIRAVGALALFEQVKVFLQEKHLLLILDNFEQITSADSVLGDLLVECPRIKIVATSRAVLHIPGEQEFLVRPLNVPDLAHFPASERVEELAQYPSVALFLQRVQSILPTFQLNALNAQAIAEICLRLDGLPLALELAAARMKLFTPQMLLQRLAQRFQILTNGARTSSVRQQTLYNTLTWSYDLLNPQEQELFRYLAIFAGSYTLAAAEAIAHAAGITTDTVVLDVIASLRDKSLLQVKMEEEETRLFALETVRAYGIDCLRTCGELAAVQKVHASYYLALVEEGALYLKGPQQTYWLQQLELEQENIRVALKWLIDNQELEGALRLCGALARFWFLRGYWTEGRNWMRLALEMKDTPEPTLLRGCVLCSAGDLAYYQNDYTQACTLLQESIVIFRQIEGQTTELANALGVLGVLLDVRGDHEAARPLLEECERLYRTQQNTWGLAYFLRKRGYLASRHGHLKQAQTLTEEALTLARATGDKALMTTILGTLEDLASRQGNLVQAEVLAQEGLTLAREQGNKPAIAIASQNLGHQALQQGHFQQAQKLVEEALTIARDLGYSFIMAIACNTLGELALQQGRFEQATAWQLKGLTIAQEMENTEQMGWHLIGLAAIAANEGKPRRALRLLGAADIRLDVQKNMNTHELANYDHLVQNVQTMVGKEVFATLWALGKSLTIEQIIQIDDEATKQAEESIPASKSKRNTSTYPAGLTGREIEILRLVAEGLTDAQIASKLILSTRTVNWHLTSIYGKIQVSSRSAATRYAIEKKLL